MNRMYIVAGDYEQARHLAMQLKLTPQEWTYVGGIERIVGIRDEPLLCYGTWRHRFDIKEIMDTAKAREMRVLHVG